MKSVEPGKHIEVIGSEGITDHCPAYQACIPRDQSSMGSAFYRFRVSSRGRVSLPKLIKSSGDPRLDEAGLCIMKMLKFTPAMQGGRAVNSTVTWELPMRPAQ
jgi:TonB family protein